MRNVRIFPAKKSASKGIAKLLHFHVQFDVTRPTYIGFARIIFASQNPKQTSHKYTGHTLLPSAVYVQVIAK